MFWLGMAESPSDLKEMEQKSFGQFWQTVRAGPRVWPRSRNPRTHRHHRGTALKRNPEKGAYGGAGWANHAASYFNDCQKFCGTAVRAMKPGGTAVIVIGNNILQGIEFATVRFFAQIAEQAGFEVIELHEVRSKRTGNSILYSSRTVRLSSTANETLRNGSGISRARAHCRDCSMRATTSSSLRAAFSSIAQDRPGCKISHSGRRISLRPLPGLWFPKPSTTVFQSGL